MTRAVALRLLTVAEKVRVPLTVNEQTRSAPLPPHALARSGAKQGRLSTLVEAPVSIGR